MADKKIKINWHEMTPAELNKALNDTATELLEARVKRQSNQLTDVRMVSKLSDKIARIKTVLSEKNQSKK